ncbi:MAG: zinc ABC transporter substrate-binding protein [Kiritimatiellae bacterium]|nr:zinc ABC transporter substrate-binding protein [Kiritimatiellia bacterium]
MKRMRLASFVFFFVAVVFGRAAAQAPRSASIVVTTTLIETAIRDLLGDDIPVVRLLPPGSCPGHFDLEPGQVKSLSSATLFIRHDFQAGLDAGVAKSGLETNRVVSVVSRPAFTIPGEYAAMCEELAVRLKQMWPDRTGRMNTRLDEIRRRAAAAEAGLADRTGRLRGRKVLCARHQRDFCRWMGLDVVAVFEAGTDESAWQLNRAVDMAKTAGAEAVIGNRQWGSRHLDALAEAAGLPGLMLSNFPDHGAAGAYWQLLDANVSALLKGFP